MPFKVLCSCGVALLAGDDLESFKVACPECGNYTLLPAIPDPYKLPSNAEMITLEVEEVAPKQKERASTVRKRGGAPRGGGRPKETELSNTNVVLIVVLVVIVFIIIVASVAYLV